MQMQVPAHAIGPPRVRGYRRGCGEPAGGCGGGGVCALLLAQVRRGTRSIGERAGAGKHKRAAQAVLARARELC